MVEAERCFWGKKNKPINNIEYDDMVGYICQAVAPSLEDNNYLVVWLNFSGTV